MKNYLVVLLLWMPICNNVQAFDPTAVDSLLKHIESHHRGMGSISLFHGGAEVYSGQFGYAVVENGTPICDLTKFQVGSVSKIFTAAIIRQMIDEGLLYSDTLLAKYFPQLPGADEITIDHLLRHRSGLYNFTNHPSYTSWMEQPKTKEELLEIFIESGTDLAPGERTAYSNTNYVLLTFIAEMVDQISFSEILNNRIVNPLQLTHTFYGKSIDPQNDEAKSYKWEGTWLPATETDMSIPAGAGAIVSTPHEVNIFLNALFNGKLVTEASLNEMTRLVEGLGQGLFGVPFYDKRGFGHTGGIDGFQTATVYFPGDDLSVSFASNGLNMAMNDVLIGVLSLYFNKEYSFPDFTPAMELHPGELEQYLGVYSSEGFPMKIAIFMEGHSLYGQASGQPSFPLEAFEKDKFRFEQAGVEMEFFPAESKMILRQHGTEFELFRE